VLGAIIHGASAVVLGHNHPSNDPTPSQQDFKMTQEVKKVADMLGICVLDHVVVSRSHGFASLANLGALN
jgi:DNA repair protein RadC